MLRDIRDCKEAESHCVLDFTEAEVGPKEVRGQLMNSKKFLTPRFTPKSVLEIYRWSKQADSSSQTVFIDT